MEFWHFKQWWGALQVLPSAVSLGSKTGQDVVQVGKRAVSYELRFVLTSEARGAFWVRDRGVTQYIFEKPFIPSKGLSEGERLK